MIQILKDYMSSFQQCSRNKNNNHKKFGLLKPLQIPSGPYNSLSMDFIPQLPLSKNFDSIFVAVDRFSKMEIFIPAYATKTALDLAQIFISHALSKHGLPVCIAIDRGSLFLYHSGPISISFTRALKNSKSGLALGNKGPHFEVSKE
ncbi:hypothetical protein O181_081234 [Austropuccinia psidii MF-1]|uniref:Integrase catalytic domain-containing protein n=1 Tax=Austropuccinia psidii MF-1 TaxID=1389203 RepID=A0A9Q3FMG3_9BASI|nr:hypothetical protein [Austropuccinia psidii MF-1]